MFRRLTIDCGNTAIKAAVWEGNTPIWKGAFPTFLRSDFSKVIADHKPMSAIICSVRNEAEEIENELRMLLPDNALIIELTSLTPLPISIGYSTPETLGVDRIAAAVGASALYPGEEILIADIGTAATYDVLLSDGCYIGGNIAPGVGMRLRALNHFTARLPLIDSKGKTPLFGNSTETALRAGAINGVVAEIIFYLSKLNPGARLLMTGGWAPDIAPRLSEYNPETIPMLVSIGLNRILSYNENI